MREAANQHNIFVCPLICRLCTHAVVHRKFKWYQRLSRARARQTIARRIKKCTMCRTDKRIAQGIQKPVGKGFKRQTQMRAPVHKTAKPSGVCQMMRSRYLVLCGSEITKPRVSSGSTALAGQMTVPLGGSHRSFKKLDIIRPACRGRGQSPPFCTRASIAQVSPAARRGANLSPAPCRPVCLHF